MAISIGFDFASVLFLHCFMASLGIMAQNLTTDQFALLAFKAQIISDPHRVLTYNWSISNPVCNWVGISCGAPHGRVTALNLSDMDLGGSIPPHLGNLSFLSYLDLSDNNFYGHLPNELGQLRRLRAFNISNNNIEGTLSSWYPWSTLAFACLPDCISCLHATKIILYEGIPRSSLASMIKLDIIRCVEFTGALSSTIFNISSLKVIYLSNNGLLGAIPVDLCHRLPGLEELELFRNNISGTIPKDIINCSSLTRLDLQENRFTGEIPYHIGNLQNLEYLYLGHNKLTGQIPPAIFNFSRIIDINLNNNDLSGNLPSNFGRWLPNLSRFAVSRNKLSGGIPNSVSNASKLTLLELGLNSFSGLIPSTFGNLRNLRSLSLRYNNLTAESSTTEWKFLSYLTSCRQLRYLDVGSNPFYGMLPSSIGNFSESLTHFFAYRCKLMGRIPIEIGNLQGLILLHLAVNNLNGSIPTTVGRMLNLQLLALPFNNLQGSIPFDLCHLERLSSLWLADNNLTGQIPTCLESLTSLRELDFSLNNFTFNIPASLWILKDIVQINLSSNSLSGSLPLEIQKLKALTYLDISRNQLSGDIPLTIGDLNNLVDLSLADNRFTGPIPDSFGALRGLESLDLSNNNLSGHIPKSLETLLYLKYFNVSLNRLEGEIPTEGPFKNFTAQSFMRNYALCGSQLLGVNPCKGGTIKQSKTMIVQVLKYILPPLLSVLVTVIVIVAFIRCRDMSAQCPIQDDLLALVTWRRISYLEIQRATDGLSESNLLGVGSFGSVYKGILSDGTNIAIKVFNLQQDRALRSFDSECEVLRNIRHRNLIKILSSCCNDDFKALVLEFMPNGSLERWLYSHNYFLDIVKRLNIMIDVASALEYLHHNSSTSVIHCDLKPNNILLDENMVAHVSDFGIAKLLGEGDSITQTMTLATIGYMAPEYGSVGIVSTKCDVYSYGVLLMETFTRKKPTDETFTGETSLIRWVKESLPHAVTEVVDANLLQEENGFAAKVDCILSIMNLALDCSMESPEQRINMKDALVKLKKIKVKFLNDVGTA